jgi:hypothetical protein
MISQRIARMLSWLVPYSCCAAALLASPLTGRAQPAQQDEVKAVVRISKELIDDVLAKVEVTGTIPYDARLLGLRVQGLAYGRGKLTAEVLTQDGKATVVAHGKGTGETYAYATLGPVLATGNAWADFTLQTLVHFNGRKFSLGETIPCVEVHAELDKLQTRHGGLPGRVAGRLARPLAELVMPLAETRADPIGDYYLVQFVNQLGGQIIDKLNGATRVEESLNRLFPETKEFGIQLSADGKFIQASYGPKGRAPVALPKHPKPPENTRMEIWLHSSNKGAEALAKISKSPLAKELLRAYMEATLPELAALTEDRSVAAVGPWIVITIGPPKTAK